MSQDSILFQNAFLEKHFQLFEDLGLEKKDF